MSDTYVKATCILTAKTEKAIQVDSMINDSEEVVLSWIPRSVIHGADDLRLDRIELGETFTFRVRAWKAAELGL